MAKKKKPDTNEEMQPSKEGPTADFSKTVLKALQASELRYRRLFETAKDGILILNAEAEINDDVNPFIVELLG